MPLECTDLTPGIAGGFIPARAAASRKGENGTVLVVGGSHLYHGAPVLSSLAALRSGTDLVYTAVPDIHAGAARAASPDLIVLPMADRKLTRGSARKLLGLVPKGLDSAAIGMGLAIREIAALENLVKSLLDSDVRLSVDAGALVPEVLPLLSDRNAVVTPHAGEFRRLFGEDPPDDPERRILLARQMADRHGVTVLLKGATDIITDGRSACYTCAKKAPAMTVGGTGDVLSGLVAGLLARNRRAVQSAAAAARVNADAGLLAQKRSGLHMVATDLIREIPAAMMPFDRVV